MNPNSTVAKTSELTGSAVRAQVLWVITFAVATAAGARFEIPNTPVPFTLQTLVVLLAGAFLGPRNGALSQLVYLGAGVAGLPVFAGGAWGLARLLGPTGGYLLAFPLAAYVAGLMTQKGKSLPWLALSFATSLLVVFVSGTLYLFGVYTHDFGGAVVSGFLIFSWWDLLKLGASTMIYHELARRWPRLPA